jgi:imidazolonepropionase
MQPADRERGARGRRTSASQSARTQVWRGARLATMAVGRPGLGIVERGALAAAGGRLVFAGEESEIPRATLDGAEIHDLDGRWITPGLIDCHTHLVHAGNRAREFELRLEGASYEEIAKAGGGILSTVRATRAASEEELVEQSLPRLDALIGEGVTTVEIKSGYGLDEATERRMLRAARCLGQRRDIGVRTSYLGAHAVPPEYADRRAEYVALVADRMVPELAREGLADAVDGFCENIAFTPAEMERVFVAARLAGLPVKLHAEQLSDLGGAILAARFRALSADHLEHVGEAGVAAMASAGTVGVMLPGAYYTLRERQAPPIGLFRAHRVPLAVATDCNPGTSPLSSLLLALNMAATLLRMTVEECLLGATRVAAQALGLAGEVGTLEPGKRADLAIWDIEQPAELVYRLGFNPLYQRIRSGG